MGIPVDKEPVLIETPNACYVHGLMPAWVWLDVYGVKKGDLWSEVHGEPRELKLKLHRIDDALYASQSNVFPIGWWEARPSGTSVFLYLQSGALFLWHDDLPGCADICPDARQSPGGNYFYGGIGEVWTTFEAFRAGYKDSAIEEIISPDDKTFFEPARSDNNIRVARYARHRDGTRVYVRRAD